MIGLPLLLFAAYQVVKITSRAGIGSDPKNVVITNVSATMTSISWTTDEKTVGYVIPMDGNKEGSQKGDARSSGRLYTHFVQLENLEPNTKYSFIIKSEGKKYKTSDGKNLEFSTASIDPSIVPGSISGTIDGGGEDTLVYAFLKDKSTYPVSPLDGMVSKSGGWIIPLNDSRKISDSSYAKIKDSTPITLVAVDGKGRSAKIEGTYADLFDRNGELKPTQDFTLGSSEEDVYSLFPLESMLVTKPSDSEVPDGPEDPEIPDEPEDPEEPYTPPVRQPSRPVEEKDEPEDVTEDPIIDEDFERIYRIVHQLPWEELSSTSTTNSAKDSFSGSKTIRVTNVTDSGFFVIWVSAKKETGYINYGTSAKDLSMKALDQRDSGISGEMGSYHVHYIEVDRLQKETKYYFEVVSGENTYDNDGSKYQVSTVALIDLPSFKTIGVSMSNIPSHGEVAVIAHIEDKDGVGSSDSSKDISCIVGEGEDQCDLLISNSRVAAGTSFYEYTDEDLLVIEPYTTSEMEEHSTKLAGLEGSGVDIALKEVKSETTSVTTTKVSALSNYGLTDSPNEVIHSNSSKDGGVNEIPKTGVFDNLLGVLIFAIILIALGVLLYILTRKKDKIRSKMVTGL